MLVFGACQVAEIRRLVCRFAWKGFGMKRVIVALANGAEDMEAVIIADVLRRAGWFVPLVGVGPGMITCSRGVRIEPDEIWDEIDVCNYDIIVLPGGMSGMETLKRDRRVLDLLREFDADGKIIAAICAAPLVLQEAGILTGRRVTCHPGVADGLTATARDSKRVVVDGNIVTSQGPGTAVEFALKLIEVGEDKVAAEAVAKGLII